MTRPDLPAWAYALACRASGLLMARYVRTVDAVNVFAGEVLDSGLPTTLYYNAGSWEAIKRAAKVADGIPAAKVTFWKSKEKA